MPERPSVSVIVPFAGSQRRLEEMLRRLQVLALADGDRAVVVDNRRDPAPPPPEEGRLRVVLAPEVSSSWYARNAGAAAAGGEWLLFIDADTRPAADLLERYFEPPPSDDVAVLAGAIRDWQTVDTLCARYVTARRKMDQEVTLAHPYGPYAQTANCMVRRQAFDAVGGFARAVTAGDADLCWRLAAAGWRLESRPAAIVEHENRSRFRDLFRQMAQHGAGLEWLNRRYPGSAPLPPLRDLAGRLPHYALAALRAPTRTEALFSLVDCAALYARDLGRLWQRER